MRITKKQLTRIIREEAAKMTDKYDDDPALKGDQGELPDHLQKGIIDKAKKKSKKETRGLDEHGKITITRRQLRRMIEEEAKKAAPFGSGMEQADLDPEQKELVGHT